jgi:Uma2 family endonuclease
MRALPEGSVREPDLLFVEKAHYSRVKQLFLDGPADLVIEIISDESVTRDRADKFYEYQAGGVREYLIIDPRKGKQRVDYYMLDDQGSYESITADEQGKYHSRVLPGFWFRKEWLLQETFPDPLRTLIEISPEAVQILISSKDM